MLQQIFDNILYSKYSKRNYKKERITESKFLKKINQSLTFQVDFERLHADKLH